MVVRSFQPLLAALATQLAVIPAVHAPVDAQKLHGEVPYTAPGSVCVMHVAQSVAVHSARAGCA